jgi:hypothetical protein
MLLVPVGSMPFSTLAVPSAAFKFPGCAGIKLPVPFVSTMHTVESAEDVLRGEVLVPATVKHFLFSLRVPRPGKEQRQRGQREYRCEHEGLADLTVEQ